MVSGEIETARDPADEGLVGMLLRPQRAEACVDQADGPAQLLPGWRENRDIIHEAVVKQAGLAHSVIEFLEKEGSDHRAQRKAARNAVLMVPEPDAALGGALGY